MAAHGGTVRRQRGGRMLTAWVVVAAALALAGCDRGGEAGPTGSAPPPEVKIVQVAADTIPISYEFVGQTRASKMVEIRARVSGFLIARGFTEGKRVQAGDPLFKIDPRPFEANLEIARARVAQAEARSILAAQEVARYTEAVSKGAASQRELDRALAEKADALASVNLAKAELAKAELDLSYTEINSPVTGLIGRTLLDEGSYLDGGPNSLLAEAMQTDPMYVEFPISERDWLRWRGEVERGEIVGPKESAPLRLTLLDGTPYPVEGRLDFFDVSVSSTTGTALARGEFANPDDALKAGQFVKVRIEGWQRPNSIVVPQRSVVQNPMGRFVFVVGEGDRLEIRPVEVGSWFGDGWLVTKGLSGGERVVVDGFMKAQPGMVVSPVR